MHESDVFRKAAADKEAFEAKYAQHLADDNRKIDELYEALKTVSSDLRQHGINIKSGFYLDKYRAIMITQVEGWFFRTVRGKNLLRYDDGKYFATGGWDYDDQEWNKATLGQTAEDALKSIAEAAVHGRLPARGDCTSYQGEGCSFR